MCWCAITNPDNRTGDVTAAHPWQSFSHTSCNGSFWSENTVSMVIVTIYRCTSRANAECMRMQRITRDPSLAMPKSDNSLWSFNLRSYNPRDFSDSEPDDSLLDNPCSEGSTLVDHPLSEDSDTAVFKPNPWSIARINAASRPAQKYALRSRVIS
jgi:hypothetical protein